MASNAPLSFICFKPLDSTKASICASGSPAGASPAHSASITCLPALLLMVPSAMRWTSAASWAAATGTAAMSRSSALRRRETSPMIQLLTSFGLPQALAAASK